MSRLLILGPSRSQEVQQGDSVEIGVFGTPIAILGLVIQDDLNFVVVGKYDYFLVDGDSMEVEKIMKLGIGNNKLLIEVLNTQGYTFYIECTKNKDIPVNSGVTLITHEKIDMLNQDSINWIVADEILDILK